jgi:hypothetical protein
MMLMSPSCHISTLYCMPKYVACIGHYANANVVWLFLLSFASRHKETGSITESDAKSRDDINRLLVGRRISTFLDVFDTQDVE